MVEIPKTKTTFADYTALPESNQIIELIDGEIVVNPPLDQHQQVVGDIYVFLASLLRRSGTLRIAPTGVRFDDLNSFEPDIFWVRPDSPSCVLTNDQRYWYGAPDLIVEILSPSTASYDRGVKFDIYEKYGVREYWLVDSESRYVEVYTLTEQRFVRLGVFTPEKSFTSSVLGGVGVAVNALLP